MTKIISILNISPESFSDGWNATSHNYDTLAEHIAQWADIVDIGAQSTAPGAIDIWAEEELKRIESFFATKKFDSPIYPFAVDTRHTSVAEYAIQQWAVMINDVSGGRHDPAMYTLIAHNPTVKYVCMYAQHSDGIARPLTPDQDILDALKNYFSEKVQAMKDHGIHDHQIILDPGMGAFVSDDYHDSVKILENISLLKSLFPYPLYICTSRKWFLKHISPDSWPQDRLWSSLASSLYALTQWADYIRVHDFHIFKQLMETRSYFQEWHKQ